ncbi:hypothetical protein Ccr5_gp040c [Caulobacter phage Ccr5]|nr:hypothetical protein Ccr5_gp040c [Caulobacter phage Ccr5]
MRFWLVVVAIATILFGALGGFAWNALSLAAPGQDLPFVTAPAAVDHQCPADPKSSGSDGETPAYGGEVAVAIPDLRVFCEKWAKNPLCEVRKGQKLAFSEVFEQDKALRSTFQYTSDRMMYQQGDFWAENAFCGDCEDYALTLARRLADAGAGGDTMWLEIWNPNWIGGHASLVVATADRGEVEINVWKGGEPAPFVATPVRLGRIALDGKLEVQLYEDVRFIQARGYSVLSKADTRAEAIAAGYLKE